METTFNNLSLVDRCNILYDHGQFIFAPKDSKCQYAIYMLDRKFNFRYCVMHISKSRLVIEDVTLLENWEVAAYLDGNFIKQFHNF